MYQTWDFVPASSRLLIVSCRWVLTIKYHLNGTVDRYKARLVTRGFTQTYGVDYLEISPVARLNSICVLFSLAVNHYWSMFQLDVKNAFLYIVTLRRPTWSNLLSMLLKGENIVCKLNKVIYGLSKVCEPDLISSAVLSLMSGFRSVILIILFLSVGLLLVV